MLGEEGFNIVCLSANRLIVGLYAAFHLALCPTVRLITALPADTGEERL